MSAPGASRKRSRSGSCSPGTPRNAHWWGPELDSRSDDEDWDEDDVSGRSPPSAPLTAGRAQSPETHEPSHKRRHLDHEMGGHMNTMSLNEPSSSKVQDIDMTSGNSYDISPHRIYVHSLDDSDSETEDTTANYHVNPYVAQHLDHAGRPKRESVPRWLATVQDKSLMEHPEKTQSLVLWQPPAWQAESAAGDRPSPDEDEVMAES